MYLIALSQFKIAVKESIMDHTDVKLGKDGMKIIQINKENAILPIKGMSPYLFQYVRCPHIAFVAPFAFPFI